MVGDSLDSDTGRPVSLPMRAMTDTVRETKDTAEDMSRTDESSAAVRGEASKRSTNILEVGRKHPQGGD